ncbi:MAG: hypothetical protein ABJF11_04155 [Reichenbachiella sp.]|uniref:hypothetical protein n=1 Tax=Reichenbachiella sp. TaxID=2184521 RepID=UPI0032659CB3
MRTIISLCILLFSSSQILAQENQAIDEWIKVLSYGVGNQSRETELTPSEVQARASQCFPAEFVKSTLLLSNDASCNDVPIMYDYREQVLLVSHRDKIHVAAPNMIKQIEFSDGDSKIKLINVSELGRSYGRKGFYEIILEDEENRLVRYRGIETIMPSYNATVDAGTKDTTYIEKKEFLIFNSQKGILIENFKSKTLEQFDSDVDELKRYVKNEKLKFKKEEDLKKLALYYWSL